MEDSEFLNLCSLLLPGLQREAVDTRLETGNTFFFFNEITELRYVFHKQFSYAQEDQTCANQKN